MKNLLHDILVRLPFLGRFSVRYCANHRLLPRHICLTSSKVIREQFFLPESNYVTQLNQDIFALLVNQFLPGYFIEIGANDGFTLSNTVYLEEHYGWRGVLVEANAKYAGSLSKRKKSLIINQAISDRSGTSEFIDCGLYGGLADSLDQIHSRHTSGAPTISVPCITLEEMFLLAQPPEIIDFLSIDVEGGEIPIVRQFVASDRRARCGCIEINRRKDEISELNSILEKSGYVVAWKGFTGHDVFFIDPKLCRTTLYS